MAGVMQLRQCMYVIDNVIYHNEKGLTTQSHPPGANSEQIRMPDIPALS